MCDLSRPNGFWEEKCAHGDSQPFLKTDFVEEQLALVQVVKQTYLHFRNLFKYWLLRLKLFYGFLDYINNTYEL